MVAGRRDVPPLLLRGRLAPPGHAGQLDVALLVWDDAVRSITVIAEPVSPRDSAQAIRRQATKLDSDQVHRTSQGFRVGAGLRRAAEAVAEREEELVSGYRELTYAGVVTVTAPSLEDLERVLGGPVPEGRRAGPGAAGVARSP